MLGSSLLYQIMIIGEASNHLTANLQACYPEVEWIDMIGMRNRVVHAYFGIDEEIVWNAVTEDIPRLRLQMAKILAAEFPDEPETESATPAAT